MKIVRIIARLNVGGPARHVVWLTDGLKKNAGMETVLVAGTVPPTEEDMSYFADAHGVAPLYFKEMSREISPRDALTIFKLWRLYVRTRPALVHTHTAKAGTVGRLAGMLYRWLTPGTLLGKPRRCKFVHTYHGHIFHSYYGAGKTRLFLLIEKFLARFATDKIIAISAQQFEEIHRKFGVGHSAEQFRVIPLGLDLSAFENYVARRHVLRAELNAPEDELLVGIVGRLTAVKNHALFLRIAAEFLQRAQANEKAGATENLQPARKVRFVLIGDGDLRGELEAQAREMDLGDRVVFTGSRNDPENFYPALDVVALTSRNEGTPLTLIEAMANARPVIATAVGGVVDLLGAEMERSNKGYALCARGVRVAPGDAEGFADGLARLLDDTQLRANLATRGREFIAQNYSVTRLLSDMEKLYAELVDS